MKKILISDLIGTIVPRDFSQTMYLYGDKVDVTDIQLANKAIDKMFCYVGKYVQNFLSEGNYLYIVTAMEGHDHPKITINKLIYGLSKYFNSYLDQVFIFMSGDNWLLDELTNDFFITENNGHNQIITDFCHPITIIKEKKEVFNFIDKMAILNSRLFAIGDSYNDLQLLFKCVQMGGKSSFIWNSLYRGELNLDEVISYIVRKKRGFFLNKEIMKMYPNFNKLSFEKQDSIYFEVSKKLFSSHQNMNSEIYSQLRNGALSYYTIIRQYVFMKNIEEYEVRFGNLDGLAIMLENEFGVYSTFASYCTKELLLSKRN